MIYFVWEVSLFKFNQCPVLKGAMKFKFLVAMGFSLKICHVKTSQACLDVEIFVIES